MNDTDAHVAVPKKPRHKRRPSATSLRATGGWSHWKALILRVHILPLEPVALRLIVCKVSAPSTASASRFPVEMYIGLPLEMS